MTVRTTLLFLAGFFLFNLLLSFAAPAFIPDRGYVPYAGDLEKTGLPAGIYSFAHFDGAIYIKIAREGYLPLTQAFFPLYPLLLSALTAITRMPYLLSGIAISIVALAGILMLIPRYLKTVSFSQTEIRWFLFFFLAFPTSFFLQAVYTESLFIFLLILALYTCRQKYYLIGAFAGYLLGLTRIIGLFAVIPLLFEVIQHENWRNNKKALLAVLMPIAGFITYGLYLHFTTGDFLAFFHLQPLSNAGRSTALILPPQVLYRYVKIFMTAAPNFQYFVAVVECIMFLFVTGVITVELLKMVYRNDRKHLSSRLGLHLFSLSSLVLPTLTGTLSSVPRYALPLLSIYLVLARIQNLPVKLLILSVSLIFHVILLLFFIQGYFVS